MKNRYFVDKLYIYIYSPDILGLNKYTQHYFLTCYTSYCSFLYHVPQRIQRTLITHFSRNHDVARRKCNLLSVNNVGKLNVPINISHNVVMLL